MKTALFIVANKNFRDEEFQIPYDILSKAGVDITVAAGEAGECIGRFGTLTEATESISEISGDDFDAVVFIGGNGTYDQYHNDEDYLLIAKEAKILAAICIASTVVSDSGRFEGKKVTGWDDGIETQKSYIESNGGIFTGEKVVVDGNIITADGPHAAEAFAKEILGKLAS